MFPGHYTLGKSELKASHARRKEKRRICSKKVALPTRILLQLTPFFN
jgi:hypothetical protein